MSSPARTRRRRLLREAAACPDCRSTTRILSDTEPGRPHVRVEHDPGCPWFRAHGDQPFREFYVTRGAS